VSSQRASSGGAGASPSTSAISCSSRFVIAILRARPQPLERLVHVRARGGLVPAEGRCDLGVAEAWNWRSTSAAALPRRQGLDGGGDGAELRTVLGRRSESAGDRRPRHRRARANRRARRRAALSPVFAAMRYSQARQFESGASRANAAVRARKTSWQTSSASS
jgi:hypothetical protein